MIDRDALEEAIATYNNRFEAQTFNEWSAAVPVMVTASRERLAQLPEKCGTCGGSGSVPRNFSDTPCSTCHGRGTVYPPALVERLAKVLAAWLPDYSEAAAVAVLDAINTETP